MWDFSNQRTSNEVANLTCGLADWEELMSNGHSYLELVLTVLQSFSESCELAWQYEPTTSSSGLGFLCKQFHKQTRNTKCPVDFKVGIAAHFSPLCKRKYLVSLAIRYILRKCIRNRKRNIIIVYTYTGVS